MNRNINNLTAQEADVLFALSEHGTIMKAADSLGISYNTFRRRLASAQEKLGIELFYLESGSYRMQKGADNILRLLRRIRSMVQGSIEEAISLSDKSLPPTIRYCYTPLTRTSDMVRNLEFLTQKYPGRQFDMVPYEGTMNERLRMRRDFGREFTIWPAFGGDTKLGKYPFQPVFEEELVLVAGPADPLASFLRIVPQQLKGREIIVASDQVNRYFPEAARLLCKSAEGLGVRYSNTMDMNLLNDGMKYGLPILVPESWTDMYPQMSKIRISLSRNEVDGELFSAEDEIITDSNLVSLKIPFGYYYWNE